MRHSMFLLLIITSAAVLGGTVPASAACSGCQGAVEKACKNMGKSCTLWHDPGGGISGCTPNICFSCKNGNCFGSRKVTGGKASKGSAGLARLLGLPVKN